MKRYALEIIAWLVVVCAVVLSVIMIAGGSGCGELPSMQPTSADRVVAQLRQAAEAHRLCSEAVELCDGCDGAPLTDAGISGCAIECLDASRQCVEASMALVPDDIAGAGGK